jgi:hypothetical protein
MATTLTRAALKIDSATCQVGCSTKTMPAPSYQLGCCHDLTDAYLDAPPPPADPQAIADCLLPLRRLLRALFNGETKILRDLNSSIPEERGRIRGQKADGFFLLRIDLQQDLTKVSVG